MRGKSQDFSEPSQAQGTCLYRIVYSTFSVVTWFSICQKGYIEHPLFNAQFLKLEQKYRTYIEHFCIFDKNQSQKAMLCLIRTIAHEINVNIVEKGI